VQRNPSYFDLRQWVEGEGRVVILGLSGQKGLYLTVSGFDGWVDADGYYNVQVNNPLTGTSAIYKMRDGVTYSEMQIGLNWQRVDLMISLLSPAWTVASTILGADLNGADGWSVKLGTTGWDEDSLYFIHSRARDAVGMVGWSSVLVKMNCANIYAQGDYDNNGTADIGDLFVLINFITLNGVPPVGGATRADANCDNYVNVTDIVYYLNFIFGSAPLPCY